MRWLPGALDMIRMLGEDDRRRRELRVRDQQIAEMTQAMHVKGLVETRACNCVGPQDGQPLCPCRMRGVEIKDGRYVMPARDLGPVR